MSTRKATSSETTSSGDGLTPEQAKELCAGGGISAAMAAHMVGVCRAEIYNLMGSGELPSFKIGKRRLIPKNAVIDLMARALLTAQQQNV